MKFYVIELSEGDKKISGKGIYEYNTLEEAIASYHGKMSTAMKSELYTREQITIINSQNVIYNKYSEVFERPIKPEPITE